MPRQHARALHVRADLLDRQLVADGGKRLLGKVDDLELTDPHAGRPPRLTAVLTGPDALGPRLNSALSRWRVRRRRRHGRGERTVAIPFADVHDIGVHVAVANEARGYEASERWLREHLIGRIPGARHADQ